MSFQIAIHFKFAG